jgi:hypothetical protein
MELVRVGSLGRPRPTNAIGGATRKVVAECGAWGRTCFDGVRGGVPQTTDGRCRPTPLANQSPCANHLR